MKSLKEYTEEIVRTFKEYEKTGTVKRDYEIAMQDLPYQIGSLTKRIMQLQNKRHREGINDEQIKEYIGDELADIFAEVLFIAHELGIDVDEYRTKMLRSDQQKIEQRQ